MHVHLVINPAAGRRSSVPYSERVAKHLEDEGHVVTRYVTKAAGDGADHVASLHPSELDVLGVVGGDGTLGEILEAHSAALPWPIAIVPMGTANLVAREARMPLEHDALATARALASGVAWPVDLLALRATGSSRTRAIANVGIGADAEVVKTIDGLRDGAVGSGSYLKWIAPILRTAGGLRVPRLRVEVDGHCSYAAHACVIQNARCYGGVFQLSPQAGLSTGKLAITLLRGHTGRDLLRIGVRALLRRLHRDRAVLMLEAQQVRVTSDQPVAVQADGDPAGETAVHVERLGRAVRLWRATA